MSLSRIFVVEDHPLILSAIENLLEDEPDLEVVGSASTGESAVKAIGKADPDLIVLDLQLPDCNGVGLIEQFRKSAHPPLIVVLTACEEPACVRQSLADGANGFVTKRSAATELSRAIHAVLAGGSYVESRIAARAITPQERHCGETDKLSNRELSVLKLVAQGYCNKEISALLNVSTKTVETYRVRASDKLEIRTRSALVRFAQVNGWLAELH